MSHDDFEERSWPGGLLRLCVPALVVAAAVGLWLLVKREQSWPQPITAKQRLAVLRDPSQSGSHRRAAADNLQHADDSVVPELVEELQRSDALGSISATISSACAACRSSQV